MRARLFAALPLMLTLAALRPAGVQAETPTVVVATLDGVIDPITANYVSRAVDRAVAEHATALVIAIDTPGGLDTSMRQIIKKMLGAKVPVIVFVSPSGSRAASAGLYITEAADVAAMAPGTNIGSAHPVNLGGSNPAPNPSASPGQGDDILSQKIENDAAAYIRALATLHHHNADWAEQAVRHSVNVPVDQAVSLGVVDLKSRDLSTLLSALDGRQVDKNTDRYTLHTANAAIDSYPLSDFDRVLEALVNPDVAYLLFLLALVGIGFWVTHQAFVLPGVVGVIAAFLAALVLFNLPVNVGGIFLIISAVVLFVLDLKATTHGVLTTGGVIALALGALLLVNTGFLAEGVNLALVLGTVLLVGGTFAFVLRKVLEARGRPYAAGEEALVGRLGTVRERLGPAGMVFVDGALWQAESVGGSLDEGSTVRVVARDGLRLRVAPALPERSPGGMTGASPAIPH